MEVGEGRVARPIGDSRSGCGEEGVGQGGELKLGHLDTFFFTLSTGSDCPEFDIKNQVVLLYRHNSEHQHAISPSPLPYSIHADCCAHHLSLIDGCVAAARR